MIAQADVGTRPDRQLVAREVQLYQVGEVAQELRRDSAPSTGCSTRFSARRLARSPNSAGIGPVNWLPERYSSTQGRWRGCSAPPVYQAPVNIDVGREVQEFLRLARSAQIRKRDSR